VGRGRAWADRYVHRPNLRMSDNHADERMPGSAGDMPGIVTVDGAVSRLISAVCPHRRSAKIMLAACRPCPPASRWPVVMRCPIGLGRPGVRCCRRINTGRCELRCRSSLLVAVRHDRTAPRAPPHRSSPSLVVFRAVLTESGQRPINAIQAVREVARTTTLAGQGDRRHSPQRGHQESQFCGRGPGRGPTHRRRRHRQK